jgi:hypothetical protein
MVAQDVLCEAQNGWNLWGYGVIGGRKSYYSSPGETQGRSGSILALQFFLSLPRACVPTLGPYRGRLYLVSNHLALSHYE